MSVIALFVMLFATMIVISGCEVGSATDPITISPANAILKKGESVAFTASGGYDYTWTLGGSGSTASVMGYLSATRGPTVVYTSMYDPGSNMVNEIISVSSVIAGDSAGSNSTSALSGSGSATITHYGIVAVPETPATYTLSITPDSPTIRIGESVTFTASGGGTYAWSLSTDSSTAKGVLSARSGSSVTYTSIFDPGPGTNAPVTLTVKSTPSGSTTASSGAAYITHLH